MLTLETFLMEDVTGTVAFERGGHVTGRVSEGVSRERSARGPR